MRIIYRSAPSCSRRSGQGRLCRGVHANRGAFAPPRIRVTRDRRAPAWSLRAHDETPLLPTHHPKRCSYASYTSIVYCKVYKRTPASRIGGAVPASNSLLQARRDEIVEIAVEDRLRVADLVVRAQV